MVYFHEIETVGRAIRVKSVALLEGEVREPFENCQL